MAFSHCGNAWRFKRDFDKAIADLDQAVQINPHCALALCHRGRAWTLREDFSRGIDDDEAALRIPGSLARDKDERKQAGQACEARFFIGEWHLLQSHGSDARRFLEAARQQCPRDFNEYLGAGAELKRLGN